MYLLQTVTHFPPYQSHHGLSCVVCMSICHITTFYRARHSFYSSIEFKHIQQEVNGDG
jgi:hypothetical protein